MGIIKKIKDLARRLNMPIIPAGFMSYLSAEPILRRTEELMSLLCGPCCRNSAVPDSCLSFLRCLCHRTGTQYPKISRPDDPVPAVLETKEPESVEDLEAGTAIEPYEPENTEVGF